MIDKNTNEDCLLRKICMNTIRFVILTMLLTGCFTMSDIFPGMDSIGKKSLSNGALHVPNEVFKQEEEYLKERKTELIRFEN